MGDKLEYSTLEISGSLLQPGFSIYLLEVTDNKEKGFYLGMTGDPFYPSARSAFHRVSAHLEKAARSTQNQLKKAIDKKFEDVELEKLKIKMHHWSIEGFIPWSESLKDFHEKEDKGVKYEKYKDRQRQVHELEKYLISILKKKCGTMCLNKTLSSGNVNDDLTEFNGLIDDFQRIVENE